MVATWATANAMHNGKAVGAGCMSGDVVTAMVLPEVGYVGTAIIPNAARISQNCGITMASP